MEKNASPTQPAIKWALISLVTSIVITYAFQLLNVDMTSSAKNISYIPFIAFLCLTQKEYKDQLGGYLTYGEGFKAGLLFSVFSGILGAIFTYLYFSILDPEQIDKILTATRAKMETNKDLSADQVDQAMNITNKIMTPAFMSVIVLLSLIIVGIIIALITSAIFKKERSPFDIANNSDYEDSRSADPTV